MKPKRRRPAYRSPGHWLAACAAGLGGLAGMGAHAEPLGCLIEPDRVAEVGTQTIGVLETLKVERGDTVKEGQLLARLAADVERASVAVAELRARADAELQSARAADDLARSKLARARDLLKQNFVSALAVEQADAEARMATQRVQQALESQRIAGRELHLSAAQLGQRDVRSPFAGIVVERYRTEGERVEREAIVRVAKVDPLRIEVIVPAAEFGRIQAGQTAEVRPDLQKIGPLTATVTLVDRVIDPASNSFRVRLTLANPDYAVPAGLRCKVDFALTGAPGKEAAASTARPVAPQGIVPAKAAPAPAPTPMRAPISAPAPAPVGKQAAASGMSMTISRLPAEQAEPEGIRPASLRKDTRVEPRREPRHEVRTSPGSSDAALRVSRLFGSVVLGAGRSVLDAEGRLLRVPVRAQSTQLALR